MKQAIKRMFGSGLPKLAALALAALASAGAQATAKPVAVWDGDFSSLTRAYGTTNYTLTVTTDSNNSVPAGDNYISIGSTSVKGVSLTANVADAFGTGAGTGSSVIMRYSNYANPNAGGTAMITFLYNNIDYFGVANRAHNGYAIYNNQTKTGQYGQDTGLNMFPSTAQSTQTALAFTYKYDSNTGSRTWLDDTLAWNSAALRESKTAAGFGIGGPVYASNSQLWTATGMKIHSIMVFTSELSESDVQSWSLTGLTDSIHFVGGDSISDATDYSTTSMSLNGGTNTISGEVTVAALFVQATTTLSFMGNAKLTVNGPIYIATGSTLKIDVSAMSGASQAYITANGLISDFSQIGTDGDESGYDYSVINDNGTIKVTRLPARTFSYIAKSGQSPSGWFSSFNNTYGDNFTASAMRIGPDGDFVYETTSAAKPYADLSGRTTFTFSIYADISQMDADRKALMVAFGSGGGNNVMLYREGDYVRAGYYNGNTLKCASAVEVAAATTLGYHLYTIVCEQAESSNTITIYKDGIAGTSSSTSELVSLPTGFQISTAYGGNIPGTFWQGKRMAVAAMCGYDVALGSSEVAALALEYPVTDGKLPVDLNTNMTGVGLTLYESDTAESPHFLGYYNNGTITIPSGASVSVSSIRAANADSGGPATVNIAGDLTVWSTSSSYNAYGSNDYKNYKGILIGHYGPGGTYNITGSLVGENAYMQTGQDKNGGRQTVNIDGGTVKVKGLYENSARTNKAIINLTNNGTLELADLSSESQGGAITKNFGLGTFKLYSTSAQTQTKAVNFNGTTGTGTTINPNGQTLTFNAGTVTGNGIITIDTSVVGSKVIFSGVSGFTGTLTIDDSNKDYFEVSDWTGFAGTLNYGVSDVALDVSAIDFSSATVNLSNGATMIAAAGQEGIVNVASGTTLELTVTEDQYRYVGHLFGGTVADGGTLTYTLNDVAVDSASLNGNNLLPYWQIFEVEIVDGEGAGAINTAACWKGNAVPTGRNAAFHVTDGAVLTVTVDTSITFGEIQVYGSGEVRLVSSGASAIIATNGFYITEGVDVEIVDAATAVTGPDGFVVPAGSSVTYSVTDKDTVYNFTEKVQGAGSLRLDGGVVTFASNALLANLTGGLVVLPDTVAKTASGARDDGVKTGFGPSGARITVYTGGQVDVANTKGVCYDFVVEDGGSATELPVLTNSGEEIGNTQRQAKSLTINADAIIECPSGKNFGLINNGYNGTSLTVKKGVTVTKKGSGDFWLCNTTISASGDSGNVPKLVIEAGRIYTHNTGSAGAALDIEVEDGAAMYLERGIAAHSITVNSGGAINMGGSDGWINGLTTMTINSGATVNCTGTTKTGTLIYTADLIVDGTLTLGGKTVSATTVSGTGRVEYTGKLPDSSSWSTGTSSTGWRGTVEIKNYQQPSGTDYGIIKFNDYGNGSSAVALNGVTSTIFTGNTAYPNVTLRELEIGEGGWTDGSTGNFTISPLYSANLTGHGTITINTGSSGTVQFVGNHTFDGSVAFGNSTGKQVAFMKTASDTLPSVTAGAIVVAGRSNMTIASGKTWTAPGGVKIDGSLTVFTDEAATATSVAPSAYLDGATITTTVDGEAGTTTYVSDKVTQISDNQASLGAVTVSEPMRMTGSGGALMSSLTINDGMTLTYDPVVTPLRVESAPVFNGTGKLKLDARYAGVTCGKFHLVTYPSSASVSGTLNDLVDSTSFNNATYIVTEETVGDYKQLVLKVGDYDNDAKEMTIAQFGDSITEGIWRTGYRGTPNYRIPLMQLLEAYGYKPTAKGYRSVGSTDANGIPADDNYKWHTGISAQRIYTGHTTTGTPSDSSLRAGFMESIEAHLEQVGVTDIITLKIGTNDSIGGETADNMFEGWSNLVWKVVRMRPTSKIVVCAPIKIRSGENNAPGLRTKIAEYVAKTAAEGGFPDGQVTMINGFDVVTDDANYYLTDNVHPNWNGHLQLANAWLPAVTNAFEGMTARATANYTAQTVASAENVAELADYRAGYVKLATFSNYGTKLSTWGETPYSYVNDTYENTPMSRVAYFVARKTTASPDTRYVWVDMDADETTGTTLAGFGVPTSASVNGVVNNLHIYSNSSAIENVAPTVSGVKGTLMLTEKGVSKADGISTEQAPTGPYGFDWNDTINDSGSWGVMNVARIFDGATPTNHRKLLAAQMLFDFNGFNGSRQNALGIGDFAVHGPYNYANATVDNFNLNWTFTTDKDEMPTMDARALESGVIEIWGKLDLTPTFTYDAYAGGTGPTGWFTAWEGEQFMTDRFRIGPNAGPNTNYVYYVFHDSNDSKAHPWVSLDSETIKTGAFSFAIYADVSQMEKNKGIIAAFGDTTKGLFLYREDDYIKLAHVVNGGITTSAWVPGVVVQPGYHLYTVSYDTQTGAAKLYLDKAVCAATTGEGSYLHLVQNDSQKGLNTGFQIGAIYRGFAYNAIATGFNFGVGLAVCAIRGFDVPLSQSHVDVLSDEFPATNGTITWDVNPDTLSQGVSYTYLVTSATVDDANYLGVTHGKLTIPEGSTVNAKLLKVLNSDATSNNAVVNIAGDLNVTASTSSHDIWGHQTDGGILLGHWSGTGTYNITGSLIGRDSYMEMVYHAGSQTINVTGGVMAVKGYWANQDHVTVNLTDGGTIEVKDILSNGVAPAQNFGYGTYRITGGDTTVSTPITFSGATTAPTTIDPYGNEITMTAASLHGTGYITAVDSSDANDGIVIFPNLPSGSSFYGALILDDESAPHMDISSFNGRVYVRDGSPATLTNLVGFTGVAILDGGITYDAREVDLSGVTINLVNEGSVLKVTSGKEGNVTLDFDSRMDVYITNEEFRELGYIFPGSIFSIDNVARGSVKYFHSEPGSTSTGSWEANDALTEDELNIVLSGYSIAPYYRIFCGDYEAATGMEYTGSLADPSHWERFDGLEAPTNGNMAVRVQGGKTLTVAIDNDTTFGELQVFGSGVVIFTKSGEHLMTVTNGLYATSGTQFSVKGGIAENVHLWALDYGTVAEIDCGTAEDPFDVAYVNGPGIVSVGQHGVANFTWSGVDYMQVSGTANISGDLFFVLRQLFVTPTGTLNLDSATLKYCDISVYSGGEVNLAGTSSVEAISLSVAGTVNVASTARIATTVKGSGRVAYTGKLPDIGSMLNWWTDDDARTGWRGTVAIKDWDSSGSNAWTPANYGNQYSTLEADNCNVYYFADSANTSLPTLKLAGNLTIYNGSSNAVNNFAGLSGSGNLTIVKPSGAPTQTLRFANGADYTGSITNAKFKLVFGTSGGEAATITVNSGATAGLGDGATWKSEAIKIGGTLDVKGVGTLDVASGNAVTINGGATISLANAPLTVNGSVTLPTSATFAINPGAIDITDANGVGVPLITGITASEDLADGKIMTTATVTGATTATFVVAKTNGEKRDIVVYKRLPVASDATAVKVPIAWMLSNAITAIAGETTIAGVEEVIQTQRGANGCTYIESYALGLTPSVASSVPTAGMTVNGDNFEIFLSNAVVPEGVVLGLSADTAAPGEEFDDVENVTTVSVVGNGESVSSSKVIIPISEATGTQRYRLKVSISGPPDPEP